MKECHRQFGPVFCGKLGEGICAMALNEALNEGNINDRDSLLKLLRLRGFNYVLRLYVVHSIDSLTDPEVIRRIPVSYKDCFARGSIADTARVILEEMTEDELGNLDALGRISFELYSKN